MKTFTGNMTIEAPPQLSKKRLVKMINEVIGAVIENGYTDIAVRVPIEFTEAPKRDRYLQRADSAEAARDGEPSPFILASLASAQAAADLATAAERTADLAEAQNKMMSTITDCIAEDNENAKKHQAEIEELMLTIYQQLNSITDCMVALTRPPKEEAQDAR